MPPWCSAYWPLPSTELIYQVALRPEVGPVLSCLGNCAAWPHGMSGGTLGMRDLAVSLLARRERASAYGHPASRILAASCCGRASFPGPRECLHPAATTNTLFH
jgi:hypothetical protein